MPDSHVYKELSADMRDGLKNIYQRLSIASEEGGATLKQEALFNEASDQLKEVVKATESAAMNIMDIVEKQLDLTQTNASLLQALQNKLGGDEDLETLRANNARLSDDLTSVLTALSFQDIAGQRVKKVLQALNAIESHIVELYLSSGLIMEAAEKNPEKDTEALKEEARKAVENFRDGQKSSTLKGPDANGVSQAAIDDMLSQLGL